MPRGQLNLNCNYYINEKVFEVLEAIAPRFMQITTPLMFSLLPLLQDICNREKERERCLLCAHASQIAPKANKERERKGIVEKTRMNRTNEQLKCGRRTGGQQSACQTWKHTLQLSALEFVCLTRSLIVSLRLFRVPFCSRSAFRFASGAIVQHFFDYKLCILWNAVRKKWKVRLIHQNLA